MQTVKDWWLSILETWVDVLADRSARSTISYWHHSVVCPSVRLSITLCTVAKRSILQQKCLNKWKGRAYVEVRLYDFQCLHLKIPTPCTVHVANKSETHLRLCNVLTFYNLKSNFILQLVNDFVVIKGTNSAIGIVSDSCAFCCHCQGRMQDFKLGGVK